MAGMSLSQIGAIAPLLPHGGLPGRSGLADLIPALRKNHLEKEVVPLIEGVPYTISFDGTTRFCNVEAFVVWVLNIDTFEPRSYLIKLQLPEQKVNAARLYHLLLNSLESVKLKPDLALAASHDSAAVNLAAVRFLLDDFTKLIDMPCTSHILDCAGRAFAMPEADDFAAKFNAFLSRGNGEAAWKDKMGFSFGTVSKTRWWSWWEQVGV